MTPPAARAVRRDRDAMTRLLSVAHRADRVAHSARRRAENPPEGEEGFYLLPRAARSGAQRDRVWQHLAELDPGGAAAVTVRAAAAGQGAGEARHFVGMARFLREREQVTPEYVDAARAGYARAEAEYAREAKAYATDARRRAEDVAGRIARRLSLSARNPRERDLFARVARADDWRQLLVRALLGETAPDGVTPLLPTLVGIRDAVAGSRGNDPTDPLLALWDFVVAYLEDGHHDDAEPAHPHAGRALLLLRVALLHPRAAARPAAVARCRATALPLARVSLVGSLTAAPMAPPAPLTGAVTAKRTPLPITHPTRTTGPP